MRTWFYFLTQKYQNYKKNIQSQDKLQIGKRFMLSSFLKIKNSACIWIESFLLSSRLQSSVPTISKAIDAVRVVYGSFRYFNFNVIG